MTFRLGSLWAALFLQGCATLTPTDYPALGASLEPLMPTTIHRTLATLPALTEVDRQTQLQQLLAAPLQADRAQLLALINSPRIRAELASLGVAEAEQFQAQLLSNPTLAVTALRPEGGGRWQLDFGLSQSLLDLITRPLRMQLADDALAEAQLKLLAAINGELWEVQTHYYRALGAKHKAALAERSLQAAKASLTLANSLFFAGNIKELTLLYYQDHKQAQERALRRARTDAEQQRLALAMRLGMGSDDSTSLTDSLSLPASLPQMPNDNLADTATLIAHALNNRLDLQIARQRLQVNQRRLAFYQRHGSLTELEVGAKVERESDGSFKAGPKLALSVPVFDRNQARLAGAEAQLNHNQATLQVLELQASTEIHQLRLELQRAYEDARQLEQEVIPQWQTQVDLYLLEYNFMLKGAFDVLAAKSSEFEAWRQHAQALEDYWVNRTALAIASAQPLSVDEFQPTLLPKSQESAGAHDHHNHQGHQGHQEPQPPEIQPSDDHKHHSGGH